MREFSASGIATAELSGGDLDEVLGEVAREMDTKRSEALRAEPDATHGSLITYERDCKINSPQRCWYAGAGPRLREFAGSGAVREAIEDVTGLRELILVRCGYKYYSRGDFIGIHTDKQQCDVTITMSVHDGAEPMIVWPELYKADLVTLQSAFGTSAVLPDSGTVAPLERRVLNVFAGHDLPHARPRHGTGETAILTACYLKLDE